MLFEFIMLINIKENIINNLKLNEIPTIYQAKRY